EDRVAQLLAIHLLRFEALGIDIDAEAREDRIFQSFEVPVVDVLFGWTVPFEDVAENPGDVVLNDEILLVEAFEQTAAQSVDGFALLVHDVVILQQVFAGFEVLAFDGLLRGFDSARDHARFDRNTFLHAEALQQLGNPLLGKNPHQIVFERKIEARRTGIALTASASAELIVDAPCFMAFGAENVQPARLDRFLVLLVSVRLVARKDLVPLIGRNRELIAGVVPNRAVRIVGLGFDLALRRANRLRDSFLHAFLLGHEFGVTAEQN